MPLIPKLWKNKKAGATPINAASLQDLEERLGAYAEAQDQGRQPADSDLTAIAALATTPIGRSLLAAASAEGLRSILEINNTGVPADGSVGVEQLAAPVLTLIQGNPAAADQRAAVAADVTVTNSVALTNVSGLAFTISNSPTEAWEFEAVLEVEAANGTADLKLGLTLPAAASGRWGFDVGKADAGIAGYGATTTAAEPTLLKTLAEGLESGSKAGVFGIRLRGRVAGGGTAGTVQLQFAQKTADASALKVLAGSFLKAERYHA
jgi:hypothetical protein